MHAHSEDILCIAVGLNNLMATSSFDGEVCMVCMYTYLRGLAIKGISLQVIVWSVVSCHMLSKLQAAYSSSATHESMLFGANQDDFS